MARRDSMTAFGQLAEAIALVSQGKPGHIVDTLIAERGQRIVKNPLWPVMRPFLYTLLRYNKALEFANAVAKMPGFQSFEYLSDVLKLDIGITNGERIPDTGGFILVSNHPTGIADGVAVFDLLKARLAGHDVLRQSRCHPRQSALCRDDHSCRMAGGA